MVIGVASMSGVLQGRVGGERDGWGGSAGSVGRDGVDQRGTGVGVRAFVERGPVGVDTPVASGNQTGSFDRFVDNHEHVVEFAHTADGCLVDRRGRVWLVGRRRRGGRRRGRR